MPENALNSLPDHWNGPLQNFHPDGAAAAAAGTREVVRCPRCSLVQFRTASDRCRRCAKPMLPEPHLEEAAKPGDGKTTTAALAASSAQGDILRPDSRLRGEITKKLTLECRLRELRKLRKWTQAQIAVRARVPRTYISRIENAHLLPGPAMVRRLAEALGVKMLDLFHNEGNDNNDPGSSKTLFWNALVPHFSQLRTEQKSEVLYRVRAMLCDRLHQQYRSQRRRPPMPASRFPLRALSA